MLCEAKVVLVQGMEKTILKNQQMTTQMASSLWRVLSKLLIKSIEIESQGLEGIGNGL